MPSSPFSFTSLIGQDKAVKMLTASVYQKKMSHAYLFRGPDGVGKKRTAFAFAAFINCHARQDNTACGSCPSCLKFRSGNHPDLTVIEPDGAFIKISQVRELIKTLAYPPYEAGYRIVLMTEVQAMRREAANSLLKTLEEPPENTVLILTADTAGKILPTIISRCQTIPFFSLPYDQVSKKLVKEHDLERKEALTLAAVAKGSLGLAEELLEKKLLPFRRTLVETLMHSTRDEPESVAAIMELAEASAKYKENLPELLDLLQIWLRDLLFVANGLPERIISKDLLPLLSKAGRRWDKKQLTRKLSLIDQARKQLFRNCNRTLVCEVLFFGLL